VLLRIMEINMNDEDFMNIVDDEEMDVDNIAEEVGGESDEDGP